MVGSVALDTITTPSGTHAQLLGGSATYFALAAHRFTEVRIVAAVGHDFPAPLLSVLRTSRIDLTGLSVLPGKTFRWKARYSDDLLRRTTTGLWLGVFATFHPTLPSNARHSSSVFLANIDPRLQAVVLSQVTRPRVIAVDTIDHWIRHEREALLRLLRQAHVVFLNEEEARLLTQARSLKNMSAWVRKHGPSIVLIKQGWYGAVGWVGGSMVWVPAYPVEDTVDPTGAGDAFAGGVLGCLDGARRITPATLRQAMLYGSCLGSFCVEAIGVSGLQRVSPATFHKRLAALKRIAGLAS